MNYVVGCFDNGPTEVQLEFDSEELFYVDFEKETVKYTGPPFVQFDPSKIFRDLNIYRNAKRNKNACLAIAAYAAAETGHPPEERGECTSYRDAVWDYLQYSTRTHTHTHTHTHPHTN